MIQEDLHCSDNIIINLTGNMISMPDAGTLQENKHDTLPPPSILSSAATIAQNLPGSKSSYSFSLGRLCDDG